MKHRLSCHLMVKNGATVVERALRSLGGIVSELCAIDTGSTDGTVDVLRDLSSRLGFEFKVVTISPKTHPDLFFPDMPESFRRSLPGRFTGAPLLADWATARNLGCDLCQGEYVLKLDADDEPLNPEDIRPSLDYLDKRPDIEIVMCPHEIMRGPDLEYVSMYSRIWRNLPHIRFKEVMHENVDWCRQRDGSNWLMAQGGLRFRDWRDSPGDGIRPPHRNFKVLLREHERLEGVNQAGTMHHNLYLADEGCEILPELSLQVLDGIKWPPLQSPTFRSGEEIVEVDRAWAFTVRGRCHELLGNDVQALEAFSEAAAYGSRRAALLGAVVKSRLNLVGWQTSLAREIERCQSKLYPFGASNIEVSFARHILDQES